MEKIIEIKNIQKSFISEKGKIVTALDSVSFDLYKGEILSLVGKSGCGKSTVLRLIAGLDKADKGDILINPATNSKDKAKIGMVFQEYSLLPWRNIIDNVAFGLEIKNISKKERYNLARDILAKFGLENTVESYPHELSGGMRQRVAIAKAMIDSPDILLMDEPFGALDPQTRIKMQEELMDFQLAENTSIIFVTHSYEEAILLADRIIVFGEAPTSVKVIQEIDLPFPRDKYTKEFKKYIDGLMELDCY